MDERRQELRLTWAEVARRAGITPEALRLIRTTDADLRKTTKDGIEDALRWERGSIDIILADGSPIPQAPSEGLVVDRGLDFDGALKEYREALEQLRQVATSDPKVSAETVGIIADWEMMLTALMFGGVTAVRRAIADSYRRALPDEGASDQAG